MTDLHILMDPVSATKRFFKFFVCWHFLYQSDGQIGSTKTQFKNIKFGMLVNCHNFFVIHKKKS